MWMEIEGVRTLVAEAGPFDPARVSLVWLHGAGMDRTVWTLVARDRRLLGWNSLALDLPGHGGSQGPAPDSIAAAARFVHRLLDSLGARSVVLAGHSMGAAIALEAAALAPGRVAALVLLGAAAALPVAPALRAAAVDAPALAAELMSRWAIGRARHLASPATPGVALREATRRLLLNARPGVLADDLAACAAWSAPRFAAPVPPALVLAGGADRMTPPRQGEALAAALPGATFRLLPAAGHLMMLEDPEAVLTAVLAVLAALPR